MRSHAATLLFAASTALFALAGPFVSRCAAQADPPVKGRVDAALRVIEFSDFECPFCARARPVIDSLLARNGADVRFEYRHYPLPIHTYAERAAQAAVEAHEQGAFWQYHDVLFNNQDRLTDADLVGYAEALGLDVERFERALREGRHAERVREDMTLGFRLAVTGTPTFFVNGFRLTGVPPLWVFELALKAALEGRLPERKLAPPSPE